MSPTDIGVALLGLLSSSVVALFAYKRGRKADVEANENAADATVFAGYSGLLQRLQEDNKELRTHNKELRRRLAEMERELNGK